MARLVTEEYVRRLHETAKAAGLHLIQSLPDLETQAKIPRVGLEPDVFCDALKTLRPKVLYWEDIQLDLDDAVRTRLDIGLDGSDAPEIAQHNALTSFLSTWRKRDGETSTAIGCFLIEGVLHTCVVNEDWHVTLEADLEDVYLEMMDLLDTPQMDRGRTDPETHARAVQLSEHAAFNAPKVSKEKRAYLAETIFPDIGPYELGRIVDRATNIAWLRDACVDEDD